MTRKIQEIVETIRSCQVELQRAENELLKLLGEEPQRIVPEWMLPRLKIWKSIKEEGGVVTKEELYQIATKVGIDNRGLGGFFTGKNASLVQLGDGKVALTQVGEKKLKQFQEQLAEDVQAT